MLGMRKVATAYTDVLAGQVVAICMAAVGKPEENGFDERLMRTYREEQIDPSEYREEASRLCIA
jgi:putative transposase